MKKIIGLLAFHICYWTGDHVSKLMEWLDGERSANVLYPVYSKLLRWSLRVDYWADLGKWSKPS